MQIVPEKKSAPSYMPYICAVLYILVMVDFVVCFLGIRSENIAQGIVASLGIVACFISLYFISHSYSWYFSAEVKSMEKYLYYKVVDVADTTVGGKTEYKIRTCDKYDLKKNKLIIYGEIEEKQPLRKWKDVNKVLIEDVNEEVFKYIAEHFKLEVK